MSKSNAVFSYTPIKNVKPLPATNRPNSANKMMKSQPPTPTVSDYSPRKCRIQTEIQSSPMRGANVNIKSKVQLGCKMSPKVSNDMRTTKPSPRKDNLNEARCISKQQQQTGAKVFKVTGVVKLQGQREDTTAEAKQRSVEPDSTSSEEPLKISVKSMRSCFEHKENKVPCRPPPSPSPSRARSRFPATPRNTNPSIKGILSSKSRYDKSPTPQMRSSNNSPAPRSTRLRRSLSTGTLIQASDSPRRGNLTRSSSQTLTPKHRVKFEDDVTPKCFSPVLLETKGDHGSGESITGEVTNLSVGVRVRPPLPGEDSIISVDGNTIKMKEHCFSYDYCFTSTGNNAASQEDVFNTMVEPLVNEAFQGYNVCLFAYGQTGSGKSYSMMGEEEVFMSYSVPKSAGIIPRFSQRIFQTIEGSEEYSQTKVEISYFEIYNEKIHDLFGPSQNGRGVPLRVREHPELGPYVVDLTVHTVTSLETLQDWLRVGNSHKVTAATEMNQNSSRSHTIFTVTLTQSQVEDRPSLCSKINLIDLAGCERVAHTCATGDRLKEGGYINRSLLTLSKVIMSLADNKKRVFIPYRESVLTWLLRESLGGNSHTAMLATINPSKYYSDDTYSTLRFACQARNIINTVRINESPHEKRIRELLEEIQSLKDINYKRDHTECKEKIKILQGKLDETSENLLRGNVLYTDTEMELEKLKHELAELRDINIHDECERRIFKLQSDFVENIKCKTTCNVEIKELKRDLLNSTEKNVQYEKEISEIRQKIEDLVRSNKSTLEEKYSLEKEVNTYQIFNRELKSDVYSLEKEVDEYKRSIIELKSEINRLNKELIDCRDNNSNYEKDISDMKRLMLEIKNNSNHDHCDNQISMLQAELAESEKVMMCYKEKIKSLENKLIETKSITNHDGCEKEIITLKQTISELKQFSSHGKCEIVIEKLKTALTEAETLVTNLESNVTKLEHEKNTFLSEREKNHNEILSLNTKLLEMKNKNNHNECEERIDTLKKALAVSKSMNIHVQCENRISELEMELRTLQSVTLADHSKCDEKISDLFFAVEKYADENNQLMECHKKEISHYLQTIQNLKSQISKMNEVTTKAQNINDRHIKDSIHFETQTKLLKEENARLKKKKVDDEKKISSLEQQVVSLTKDLLDVKNQLRNSTREKESSDMLCAQLKEQMIQQDRKLAESKDSSLLLDNKENWETPSKVIRRSIARHANNNNDNDRCSLVMKAEEIHQALKDAEDICSRLKIPWVFQLEPEVTTHSWFDVNLRVWDQRNMSSVRWPREVFLRWLREMKEEIMSKSRGHKLFHTASWLQNNKDAELQSDGPEHLREERALRAQIQCLHRQITELQNLCDQKAGQEVLSAITALGKSVSQLSNLLGHGTPLQLSNSNSKR